MPRSSKAIRKAVTYRDHRRRRPRPHPLPFSLKTATGPATIVSRRPHGHRPCTPAYQEPACRSLGPSRGACTPGLRWPGPRVGRRFGSQRETTANEAMRRHLFPPSPPCLAFVRVLMKVVVKRVYFAEIWDSHGNPQCEVGTPFAAVRKAVRHAFGDAEDCTINDRT